MNAQLQHGRFGSFTSVWVCPLPAALRTSILEARSRWVSDPLSRQAMFQMAHTYEMMANGDARNQVACSCNTEFR
jgi:hypothetical protein